MNRLYCNATDATGGFCSDCPANTYQDTPDNTLSNSSCLPCAAGTGSLEGSAQCCPDSYDDYETMCLVFGVLWGVLLAAWLASVCWHGRRQNTALQRVLGAFPALAMLRSLTLRNYVLTIPPAQCVGSMGSFVPFFLADGAAQAALCGSLLLIGKGYMTVVSTLEHQHRRAIFFITNTFVLSYWCNVMQPDSLFILFFLMMMYSVVLRCVFMTLAENCRLLQEEVARSDPADVLVGTRASCLLVRFARFRTILSAFVGLYVFALSIEVLWASSMYSVVVREVVLLLLAVGVGVTFRLQSSYPFTVVFSSNVPLISNDFPFPKTGALPPVLPGNVVVVIHPPALDSNGRQIVQLSLGMRRNAGAQPRTKGGGGAAPRSDLDTALLGDHGGSSGAAAAAIARPARPVTPDVDVLVAIAAQRNLNSSRGSRYARLEEDD